MVGISNNWSNENEIIETLDLDICPKERYLKHRFKDYTTILYKYGMKNFEKDFIALQDAFCRCTVQYTVV